MPRVNTDGEMPSGFVQRNVNVQNTDKTNSQQDESALIADTIDAVFPDRSLFFSVNADNPERCTVYEKSRTHFQTITRSGLRRMVLMHLEEFNRKKFSNKLATEVIHTFVTMIELRDEVWADKVNPDGFINCSNGIVKISAEADPQLFGHGDPAVADLIFLSEPLVRFDPMADKREAERLLYGCLEGESLMIYKRLIGSTLNFSEVVNAHARIPMVVSADSSGMNGKSVNDECVSIIHGETSVAHVGLETFKDRQGEDADKNGMWQLINKRYNCPTESLCNFNISDCKLIKQTTSGEDITTRSNYRDQMTFRPRCGMHFSLNRMPLINSNKESATSRIRVIQWPFTFKMSPNPNNRYERQADPKLDPKNKAKNGSFIYEELLPGYLLLMIEGFNEAIQYGFPESESLDLIKDIQGETDHVAKFLSDMGLVRSESSTFTLSIKELYALYEFWLYEKDAGLEMRGDFGFNRETGAVQYNPQFKQKRVEFEEIKAFPTQLAKHLLLYKQIRTTQLSPKQAETLGIKRVDAVRVTLADDSNPAEALLKACGRQQVGQHLLGFIPTRPPLEDWENPYQKSNF